MAYTPIINYLGRGGGEAKHSRCNKYKHISIAGVEIALIRLSGLSKKLSGQVDRPGEVIRRTSR